MLVRFLHDGATRVGLRREHTVTPLAVPSISDWLRLDADDRTAALDEAAAPDVPLSDVRLLAPVDGRMEVWASGVTYRRSREAREEESRVASVYELVYDAERPELFPKAPAWRVVTDGDPVGVREDSRLNVPEAELALVLSSTGEIAGYTVCNDMSSRDIEGENPLYLPQAKVYAGSCVLSPGIRLAGDVADPDALVISARITRGDRTVWEAATSTAQLHRRPVDLAAALLVGLDFPDGVVLSTGTGIVPDLDTTTLPGDVVRIEVEGIGTITNQVVLGKSAF